MKCCAALLLFACTAAPTSAEPLRWAKVESPDAGAAAYVYSQPLYTPARRAVLHWGRTPPGQPLRNDVLAFDFARQAWVVDAAGTDAELLRRSEDRGVTAYGGRGELLDDGRPAPSFAACAVCYDTKRRQLVYTLKGLMVAYDPATHKWSDLHAKTVLDGRGAIWPETPYARFERGLRPEQNLAGVEIAGGPPVYGAGACYDPVNDEILLFPHWGGHNTDRREFTGETSGHTGTWIYRYADNRWRRATPALGDERVRAARRAVLSAMQQASRALDDLWRLRAAGARGDFATIVEQLTAAGAALDASKYAAAGEQLKAAAGALRQRRSADAERLASGALWRLSTIVDGELRVEPPPRCATPLVYDPQQRAIVMFGGHDGLVRTDLTSFGRDPWPPGRNDTWLYDVATRSWREVSTDRRPPPQSEPLLVYDNAAEQPLLVTRTRDAQNRATVALWSFSADDQQWQLRHEEPWPHELARGAGLALDESRRTLVLTQPPHTFLLPLAESKLPAQPAPVAAAPPIAQTEIPPDDRAWLAELPSLPANRWIHPPLPRDADTRDWGTAACDPLRGWVYYFGGGHSTYQVNDVAIYVVGANRWVHAAGDHNDWTPPVHWDGISIGLRGGPPAGHQRNSYVAIDGRMYVTPAFHSRRWDAEIAAQAGDRVAWFYDVDRGGVWRQEKIADVQLADGVSGSFGRAYFAHPSRKVLGFAGCLEPYDGRVSPDEAYFSSYDIVANKLSVVKIPEPRPQWVGEGRPFCLLADREAIFFCEHRADGGHGAWLYDIAKNQFRELKPQRQPPADARTVEYLPDQKAVFAIIGRDEPWVYSLERNTWAKLPTTADRATGFATPYAQLVYVAKHGVLVNVGSASRGLAILRPEASAAQW